MCVAAHTDRYTNTVGQKLSLGMLQTPLASFSKCYFFFFNGNVKDVYFNFYQREFNLKLFK